MILWAGSAVLAPVGFTALLDLQPHLLWLLLATTVMVASVAVLRPGTHLSASAVYP